MTARQTPPRPAQIARQLLGDFEHTLELSNWAEIDGDDPEAAALALGWRIEHRHALGVVASDPGATWVVRRWHGRTIAALAMQRAGTLPSIRRLRRGVDGSGSTVIVDPPPGWRVTSPGMYGRVDLVVEVEQLDAEVLVAVFSSPRALTAADAAAVATAFGGPGAEVVSRTPLVVGGRLRYARMVAMLSTN